MQESDPPQTRDAYEGPSRRKERHFGLHGWPAARARLTERGVARAAAGSPTQVGGSSRGPNKVT